MPNVSKFGAQTDNAVVQGTVTDRAMVIPDIPPQGLMSVGPRVTPHFVKPSLWSALTTYHFFDAVHDATGASYVAIKPEVPAGTELTDEGYWFRWADPNSQFADLSELVKTFDRRISQNANDIKTKAPNNHASEDTIYGVGNEVNYGHVKLASENTPLSSDSNAGIAATPKMVQKYSSDFVNVNCLGAVGNGTFDNSDVFNDAFAKYSCIYIPEGNYVISKPLMITKPIKLIGAGRKSVIRTAQNFTSNVLTIKLDGAGHDSHLGLALKDFSIVPNEYNGDTNFGDYTSGDNAIYVDILKQTQWVSYMTVDNVTIGAFKNYAFYLNNTQNDGLFNTKIINCKWYGGGAYLNKLGDSCYLAHNAMSGKGALIISNVDGAYSSAVVNNNITLSGGVVLSYGNLLYENNQMECAQTFTGSNGAYLTIDGDEIVVNNCNINVHDNNIDCIYATEKTGQYTIVSNTQLFSTINHLINIKKFLIIDNVFFIKNGAPFIEYPFTGTGYPVGYPVPITPDGTYKNKVGKFTIEKNFTNIHLFLQCSNDDYISTQSGTILATLPFNIYGSAPMGIIDRESKNTIAIGDGKNIKCIGTSEIIQYTISATFYLIPLT